MIPRAQHTRESAKARGHAHQKEDLSDVRFSAEFQEQLNRASYQLARFQNKGRMCTD